MATGPDDQRDPHDNEDAAPSGGQVDSDDTTQADAGMAGGTGALAGEATVNPGGTEPHSTDEETGTSERQ